MRNTSLVQGISESTNAQDSYSVELLHYLRYSISRPREIQMSIKDIFPVRRSNRKSKSVLEVRIWSSQD